MSDIGRITAKLFREKLDVDTAQARLAIALDEAFPVGTLLEVSLGRGTAIVRTVRRAMPTRPGILRCQFVNSRKGYKRDFHFGNVLAVLQPEDLQP